IPSGLRKLQKWQQPGVSARQVTPYNCPSRRARPDSGCPVSPAAGHAHVRSWRESRNGGAVDVQPVARIAGALLFTPAPHRDERGFFSRTFDAEVARAAGLDPAVFAQDSISRSARGVIRGMHIRSGAGEAKLVRCSYGAIFDVIVDLRPASPTYRN